MEFGQKFRSFSKRAGFFTRDRLFYFPSEGRHAVDFSSRKNPTVFFNASFVSILYFVVLVLDLGPLGRGDHLSVPSLVVVYI
jgi:hypothetical protein